MIMSRNKLETSGAIKVARVLKISSTLTLFVISDNYIGSEAVDNIAAVLACNTKLQSCNAENNSLETCGVIKITEYFIFKKIQCF